MVPIRGHAGHWRWYAAAGIAVAILCLGPEAYGKARSANTGANPDQRGTAQTPLIVETHPAPKTPEESRADKREADDKRQNDGALVRLTFALAVIGALQLVVFGYQAYKLRQTVADSKDAIGAAQRSAQAAENSLAKSDEMLEHARTAAEESRQSERRIERGYLFMGVDPDCWLLTPYGWRFTAQVKNFGKTPAIVKSVKSYTFLPADSHQISSTDSREVTLDSVIASGVTDKLCGFDYRWPKVKLGVVVEYEDIFGIPHFSRAIYDIDCSKGSFVDGALYPDYHNAYWNAWD